MERLEKTGQTSGVSGKGTGAGRKVSIFGRVFAVSACVMAMTFAGTMYAAGMEEGNFSGIDVTIRAFYTDHNLKYGVCPDSSYTAHPIQVFLTEKIPDGLLSDTTAMTLNGFNYITRMLGPAVMPWIEIRGSRAGTLEIESPQTGFGIVRKETGITGYTVMRYSYFSPSEIMCCYENPYEYYVPQFYAMAERQKYVFARKGHEDSLRVTFDIPESLFYLRSDMALEEDPFDPDIKRLYTTTDKIPSFFLYYKPAFIHEEFKAGSGLTVDLLVDCVDRNKSRANNLEPLPSEQSGIDSTIAYIKAVVEKIESETGGACVIPGGRIEIVFTKQIMFEPFFTERVFSWGKSYSDDNRLVLADKSDYSKLFVHELLHQFFQPKDTACKPYSAYEKYIIKEALIEYVATVLNGVLTGEDGFVDKKNLLEKNGYDKKSARKASMFEENVLVSMEGSSSWLYYQYIPWQLHKEALKDAGDEEMMREVLRLLVKGKASGWDKEEIGKDLAKIKKIIGV